ncbi:Zinc finger protein, protein [Aphelenchoides bicaudatus]|nr:Zinc finger protein, protein [Aphelenchoides bicaudatus]
MQPTQQTSVQQITVNPKFGPIHIVTRRQTNTRRTLTPPVSAPNRLLSPTSTPKKRPNSALSRQPQSTTSKESVTTQFTSDASKSSRSSPKEGVVEEKEALDPAPKEKVVISADDSGVVDQQEEQVEEMLLQRQQSNQTSAVGSPLQPCGLHRKDSSTDSCTAEEQEHLAPVDPTASDPAKSQQQPPILTLKRASPASNSTLSGDATPNKKSREGSTETIDLDEDPSVANEESTLASAHLDTSSFGGSALQFAAHHNIQNFSCDTCKVDFQSAKMLQQHNQQFHADKNYVCEICSKAFRFRSNLAEHRSVHTALKPFVCKFCGKSSRLKGNLTKHILKHHKSEQLDYIGTDEIIIKKGKKSVKDPMAIEFLEKSMIVMTPTQAQSPGLFNTHVNNGGNSSRHSTSNLSASDGSMTPLNGAKQDNTEFDNRGFLMSLGLDSGSLDLKAESSESDSSVVGGSSTTNDQLLEKCNLFMDTTTTNQTANEEETIEDDEEETPLQNNQLSSSSAGALLLSALQQSLNGKVNGQQRNGWQQNKGQQRSSFLDGLAAELSREQLQKSAQQNATPSRQVQSGLNLNGSGSKATTCPECGKHVRKPRDLITHLATIHGIAPSGPLANSASHSQSNGQKHGEPVTGNGVQADLRQLLQLVLEMKSTNGQVHKVEQLVTNIDNRVGRLEKQLEMALNSIYTLVQLQTGINSQLSRFKEETSEQLKTIFHEINQQKSLNEQTKKTESESVFT